MAANISAIVADAGDYTANNTEDVLRGIWSRPYDAPEWYPYKTYGEWLTRTRVNMYGKAIPQIEIVKQNLRAFKRGNTREWRGLNVQDRRQHSDRRRRV